MAGRDQQDAFIDDSEESCPLCVEEFDLSDKNFKPCPCGYQVCQFCFNNIKNNMNGLCPACRRPYDDKTIEWKIVSPEEFKADIAAQAKKKAAARQKEAERKQVESLNRKHLAGLRVLQKNLVYIMGMNTSGSDDDLEVLRGPQHFGQYGKIAKIAASKAREGYGGHHSAAVYVTFANKDDARDCIAALDGTMHGGRMLKAQYGTTKYCAAFLRNETCNNRHCTFLHETGDENDSFSRQDLSSLNAVSSQRPAPSAGSGSSSKTAQQLGRSQAHHSGLSQAPAAQFAKSEAMSRSDSGDGSALPNTANWAKNPQLEQSRRSSQAASRATPSPKVANAKMAPQRPDSRAAQSKEQTTVVIKAKLPSETPQEPKAMDVPKNEPQKPAALSCRLAEAVKMVNPKNFSWALDRGLLDQATLDAIAKLPPMIDENGGAIRLSMKRQQDAERQKQEEVQAAAPATTSNEEDEVLASGSLQLGGEPETAEDRNDASAQSMTSRGGFPNAGAPGLASQSQQFESHNSLLDDLSTIGLGERCMTPQQQRNLALLKNGRSRQDSAFEQTARGPPGNGSQHQSQLSNPFQNQNQQLSALSRHGRHGSRYTFANDTASASTAVKPATNAQLLAQQSAMMPPNQQKPFSNQSQVQPNLQTSFYSGVQGPPPGLKSSGTPPISGGGMFGQGHGFASAMGGSAGFGFGNVAGRGNNDDLLRDIVRGRSGVGNAMGSDSTKSELDMADPGIVQARMHLGGVGQGQFGGTQAQVGAELAGISGHARSGSFHSGPVQTEVSTAEPSSRSGPGTPIGPPGLSKPSDFPPLVAPKAIDDNTFNPPSSLPSGAQPQRVKPAIPSLGPIGSRPTPTSKAEDIKTPEPVGAQDVLKGAPNGSGSQDALTTAVAKADDLPIRESECEKGKFMRELQSKEQSKSTKKEPSSKRQRPKKLEIPGVKKAPSLSDRQGAETLKSSQPPLSKQQTKESITNASVPATPATAVSQSSASSVAPQQPRTLRVISASKAEVQQKSTFADPEVALKNAPGATKTIQPQQAADATKQPETPLPDTTDSASITSTPISRATSPSRKRGVEAATKRPKDSKNKEPKAAQDAESKGSDRLAGPSAATNVVQEPIVGRKKKSKKPKALSSLQNTETFSDSTLDTPALTQSKTKAMGFLDKHRQEKTALVESKGDAKEAAADRDATPADDDDALADLEDAAIAVVDKGRITASTLFGELVKRGHMGAEALDLFLHPLGCGGAAHRLGMSGLAADPDGPTALVIADADKRRLDNGEPIVVRMAPPGHAVILPDRSMLRFLLRDEAERYLRLRKDLLLSGRVPATALAPNGRSDGVADLPVEGSISIAGGLFGKGDEEEALLRASAAAAAAAADGGNDFCLPNPQDMAQEYGTAAVAPDDSGSCSAYYTRGPPTNEGLAERMVSMTLEDAAVALEQSEAALAAARKDTDMLEKKMGQVMKKNRKMLKEWSRE